MFHVIRHYTAINCETKTGKPCLSHEVDQVLCPHGAFLDITRRYVRFFFLKRNAQFVQKLAFEALMDLNKTIMEIRNVTKAATFKSFSQLSYKYSQLLFL